MTYYYGTVELDTQRIGTAAGKIAEELIVHLKNLAGAKVTVTLEIHAEVPDGVPENVVRTVNENSRTLKLTSHSFESK